MLPSALAQVDVEAHADVADQQPAGGTDPDAIGAQLHQAVIDEGLQQRQIGGKVAGKVELVA